MISSFAAVRKGGLAVALFVAFMMSCGEPDDMVVQDDPSVTASSAKGDSRARMNSDMQRTFTAHMTGDQERPMPVETDGSGQAIFKLSKDGTSLSYKIIVNNVENITQAHIHCGDAETAGPVVAFLFGFVPEGVTKNGVLAEGTITAANVIARPDSEACMGGVANFDQLIAKLRSGDAYVNVHTVAYPPGEIRGQIK